MVFLSETTKLEMNWLFLDHEVTSDTMLVDYLNPAGAPVLQYLGGCRSKWNWPCYSEQCIRTAEYYLSLLDSTVQFLDCIQMGVLVVSLDGLKV